MILAGLAMSLTEVLSQQIIEEPVIISRSRERDRGDFYIGQDIKSTRLTLSKDFKGESASKTGTFVVEEGIRMLEISIKGVVWEGQISISISKPGKNMFKDQVIDTSADVEWKQMFTIREDSKEYTGEWTYKIEAVKAKGFYNLSFTAH